ncbi:4467_t:CDS:2 [Funneliformis mosseae]|uniref:4467_t:CDS:1 n=1 Tax=Funneliformis mosseae TaxID=27381 RepID=A0A9N9GPP4_FUNMO|nr:4467_t:CDS:2 [Funneliformis mosseae]
MTWLSITSNFPSSDSLPLKTFSLNSSIFLACLPYMKPFCALEIGSFSFFRIQHSVFRHNDGCYLQHAIFVMNTIRRLSWAGGTAPNLAPHIRSIIISIQKSILR